MAKNSPGELPPSQNVKKAPPAAPAPARKPAGPPLKPTPPKPTPPPPADDETSATDSAPAEDAPPAEKSKPAAPAAEKPAAKPKPKVVKRSVGVWGIDLGQCGLKAIRLAEVDGEIVATAFDFVEHPKILSQPDADPDQLTREALEKFLARNPIKGDLVAISVPGQSGLARFVKLPPVEEKKISDIVKFEAKQQIPFPLEEVVWDYQKLGSGIVTDGFALDTEIGLFAMKRDMVNKYLQHFKDVHVDVHVVQMAPLALCNYVAFDQLNKNPGPDADDGKKTAVVALDIGTDSSNLVITDGGRIIWQRPIPLGGNHFTRALTKDLKLTFAKAEHLKRNAMKSPDLKKILAAIKPVLSDFVSEVQRSLGYFTNTHRDVQVEYMVGLGNAFRLPGLQRFLSEKLQLEVRKGDKLLRVKGPGVIDAPVFNENVLSFAVAYGLAVQGLQKARLLTNLLPHEIRMERLIKAKKPWAVAAAAVLLLSVAGLTFGYGRQADAYGGQPIQDAKARGAKILGSIAEAKKKYDEAKRRADTEEAGIASVVAGQVEQLNWLHLTQFIDEIIPRPEDAFPMKGPDGKPLPLLDTMGKPVLDAEGKPKYRYNLPARAMDYLAEAQEAYTTEWLPWRAGRPNAAGKAKDDELGDGLDRLIQFNIEAISCRYSDDLSVLWANLDDKVKDLKARYILPEEDRKKPLTKTDKGWVIELRGYTFHKDANIFVENVLMENIVRRAAEHGPDWPLKPHADKPLNAPPVPPAPGIRTAPAAPAAPAGGNKTISHVTLAFALTKKAEATTPYEHIGGSKLVRLLTPAPPPPKTGTPQTPAPPQGGGGGGAAHPKEGMQMTAWVPLGIETVSVPPAPPKPVNPPPKEGDPPPATPRYERTEFVILFIWREPSPSDKLLTPKPAAPQAPAGGKPGPNQQPPNQQPPNQQPPRQPPGPRDIE